MSDFVKGDTVRLKSGGPLMTIETIDALAFGGSRSGEKDHAWCQWFHNNKLEKGTFPLASLEKS